MEALINQFSYGLFFWQLIILLIVIFILGKFAWKPIVNALDERETGISNALAAAEKAKLEMTRLTNENEQLLKEARAERDLILKEAKELKEKIVIEARDQAHAEGKRLIAQAKQEIDTQKTKALAEVKAQVSELSIEIARKVLSKEFEDQGKQQALVADLLKDVKLN
ncbi:F0F1 ATP synthase subunit B [Sphingobacterium spiritivorum]|uniref:ATP synthase subunit b n=3 Tax=Sphingobacterium spiritivorum TaxID=258 RepID=D7VMZ0_SPHSI|nr:MULTISPECIES: F0F1 ATP synthase subunit B [Sphingobacterium]EEI94110.1 ATP synthase F0, B subunit [Sphingobacterium spiritivorum ATCC 33300]EFK57287.1 ATP synthase F0, B subunit [Sphingobacterium spiritivorum ATCC 33861]QQS94387.1 F0F1 ATP synthase subunit B [Sphingobacterium spiritivorum]QQT26881.1 F0F1 ATP synthase subunit B [Sphingobacterium spiritivorum]QQT36629.1 F0F1 ATP synthase subunit B [Sphingobacterium spiritivorum]